MRTLIAVLGTVLVLLLAGCGGDDNSGGGSADTGTTTEQATTQETTATDDSAQASAEGKQIFTDNCAGCHTLADAGANGQSGPNLDELKPDQATVAEQVTNGGGNMPAFKDRLSEEEIQAVATYVSEVAGQ